MLHLPKRRLVVASLTVAASLLLTATPSWAHGGKYTAPSDASGPNSSSGGAVGPPTNPDGAAAAGPGAANSGRITRTTAGTTRGTRRGDSGGRGPVTGTTMVITGGFEGWEFWWEANRDELLGLKDRLTRSTSLTMSLNGLSGRGRPDKRGSGSRRASRDQVDRTVMPVLHGLLSTASDRDILDSSILALGRSVSTDQADLVLSDALGLLSHPELSVQTSAALSLGVLGDAGALAPLRDLLADTAHGRQLVGGGPVPWLVRSFAALGLGLLDDAGSEAPLLAALATLPDSERDIKVCAIVALGLLDPELRSHDEAHVALRALLVDRRLDDLIKAQVPTALAKLGNTEDVPLLSAVLDDADASVWVRQSATIALGRLAGVESVETVDRLLAEVADGKDAQTRRFALIALARIGASDPDRQALEVHDLIERRLLSETTKPSHAGHESWGGLALALYARQQDRAVQARAIDRLLKVYAEEKDPSNRAAFAVSLGLLDAQRAVPLIEVDFVESSDRLFKGYAAVALGLLGARGSAPAMRAECQRKSTAPNYRLQLATGLGLLRDEESVDVLMESLANAQTLGVSSALAQALGLIGDERAIGGLARLAEDAGQPSAARAFAAVSLGLLAERTALPWNAAIKAGSNYRARVPALDEVFDIL